LEGISEKLQCESEANTDEVIAEIEIGPGEQPDGKLDSGRKSPEVNPDSPRNSKKIFVVQK
jgi:hypothetical protein